MLDEQDQFQRTRLLIGDSNLDKLGNSNVIVFGVGGVGGYVVEALARCGVGSISVVDNDKINLTNLNRQIIALHSTIDKDKVDVIKQRVLDINPKINIKTYKTFFTPQTKDEFDFSQYDYIIDAIDFTKGKLELVKIAKEKNIPIISSMGTGNKLNPQDLIITDISKTHTCPLARVMRIELKKMGIRKLKVIFSKEQPIKHEYPKTPASISFVPPVAGLMIASEVIKDLIKE